MPRWGKAVSEHDAFFGFVAGILIMGALFIWLLTDIIWTVPLSLFVMGMIAAADTLFPQTGQPFAASWLGGVIAGCFAILFTNAYGFMYWLLAAATLVFILHILAKIARQISK